MKPQVYHVDAFTSQPFAAILPVLFSPADNLSEAQMQLIAREFRPFGNCFSAAQRRQRCAHPLLYANG
ncbi:phenazine biosynthesis protein PhzF family protein [Escherichia coli]|uniref:Phenazine biosynthesis protein PhzF family protein n=1 Tax=Escherichia coli TaxID=562 RepID=A0A2X1KIC6_ECOLX|nr:phenazine biosynthesis protein PhzF family protein [Escherichia coli]